MNETWAIVLFVGAFALIGVASAIKSSRRKKAQWSGVVIDKDISEHVHRDTTSRHRNARNRNGIQLGGGGVRLGGANNSHVSINYFIRVKTHEGEEISWPISEGLYQEIGIGDQLQKDSGTKIPRITQKAQTPAG